MDPKDAKSLNPRAIFSKTGKGVQEASGKTSHLSRADRAVLAAIDGKTVLSEVQGKFEKLAPAKFDALIQQLDKDGFIREVSSGEPAIAPRAAAPAAKAAPKAPPAPADEGSDGLDFTQLTSALPKKPSAPKPPPVDLAAAARAEAERRAKEQQAVDFRARQEAEARAKAEAEAKARAEAEAKAVAEAKARAEAASRAQAEAEAKVKAAREAAVRLATEAKAKAEADAKAKAEAAEKEKERLEAELTAKIEAERKAREEAERRAAEAAEQARKDLEEKAKRDAEEMRQRLEAEMKAKLEAERKAREEEDRKRREEEDRRRKEEDERRRKEEEERRAKEEAERKAREEAERKKREEEDRKRREEDERRRKEDEERRAREEAERKKREEEDRKRREEDERRRKEGEERRAKEDAERRAREEADAKARAAADAAASLPKVEAVAPAPPPAAAGGGLDDSLLADLDSFGKREEEEQKAREEAERKAKEESARREKEDAERRAKEEDERKRREEEGRRRKEEEERRAKEEAERREREEEERREQEEEERKRKEKEERAAKQAAERAEKAAAARGAARGKPAADEDDIPVTEDDLDTDDLKRDQKVAAERARRAAREAPPVVVASGRPRKLGKPIAIALAVLLVAGIGVLNVMPVSTADYEKAASEAMGAPVKIGSARLSVLTGVDVKLEGVTVGSAVKIRSARGALELGSLFGAHKAFSRIDLEGVQIAQTQLGDALLGKVSGANFRVGRVVIKQVALDGPLKLPPLDVDAKFAADGTLQSVKLAGGDKIVATLSPKGSDIGFEISAGSLELPFVPALSLSEFAMKGTANRSGVVSSEFDGRVYDGVLSGSARMRWGDTWTVEGEVKARNLKVAVFAPTLVSDGRIDGRAAYVMSGSAPGSLYQNARMQGEFKIDKGVLGSFDVSRALQTNGTQSGGRTVFNEMSGQGLYDKGAMQFTNVVISAGALNAGASLHIDTSGNLSGRIVADVKTASQKQSATLNIGGKVQEPVIRK